VIPARRVRCAYKRGPSGALLETRPRTPKNATRYRSANRRSLGRHALDLALRHSASRPLAHAHGGRTSGAARAHGSDVARRQLRSGMFGCRVSAAPLRCARFCARAAAACDAIAATQKNGEKKLRAQLCRTGEWADPAARACVATVCAAAAQDDTSGAFATLAAVMRGDDTSASLRKSHLLMLARCWGYKSELWVHKAGRKRLPLQPEPMPPPLAPRRADARAAAAAARAAADEARRVPAVVQHSPTKQQQQQAGYLMPCVANAIVAALIDSSGSGGEGGRYSSTLSDGHTQPKQHPGAPNGRSSCSSIVPLDDAGMRAWLTVDAQALGSAAQAEAEAATRAWRERAAAHAAAAAPQHVSASQLAWGAAPPIGRWLAEQHCATVAGGDAFAAVMQHGGVEYDGDDPMNWSY